MPELNSLDREKGSFSQVLGRVLLEWASILLGQYLLGQYFSSVGLGYLLAAEDDGKMATALGVLDARTTSSGSKRTARCS